MSHAILSPQKVIVYLKFKYTGHPTFLCAKPGNLSCKWESAWHVWETKRSPALLAQQTRKHTMVSVRLHEVVYGFFYFDNFVICIRKKWVITYIVQHLYIKNAFYFKKVNLSKENWEIYCADPQHDDRWGTLGRTRKSDDR